MPRVQFDGGLDWRVPPSHTMAEPVSRHQPLRGFVVLIVDDDVHTVEAAASLVRQDLGCDVLTASSSMEALRMIRSGLHVDLVFSDVIMPEMDGLMLAEAVRQWLPDVAMVAGDRVPRCARFDRRLRRGRAHEAAFDRALRSPSCAVFTRADNRSSRPRRLRTFENVRRRASPASTSPVTSASAGKPCTTT